MAAITFAGERVKTSALLRYLSLCVQYENSMK